MIEYCIPAQNIIVSHAMKRLRYNKDIQQQSSSHLLLLHEHCIPAQKIIVSHTTRRRL